MIPTLKSKIAVGALVMAVLAHLAGTALLCYCPGPFVFAIPFTVAAVVLGSAWSVRVVGICLCAASIVMAIHQFERKQHMEATIKAAHANAMTNSIGK